MPITSALGTWLILDERIGWMHIAGIILALAGILRVANGRAQELPLRGEPIQEIARPCSHQSG